MGIIYSQKIIKSNEETDTLCFNMDSYLNDITSVFYDIILKIEYIYKVKLNTYLLNQNTNLIHTHFEIKNCLFEIKLLKQEKVYSLGYIQIRLKMFTQPNDFENKKKFNNLCSQMEL